MPSTTGRASDAAARLLLIDRDPAAGRVMSVNLGGSFLAPPRVTEVPGGRQAAELLKGQAFDIVLVDLASLDDLSVQTEDAVARLVKLAAGALVVALSDGASVSSAVAAMRAGAHDYVPKPINGQAFATRIGELAHRHGKARALTIDSGTAELADGFPASSAPRARCSSSTSRSSGSPPRPPRSSSPARAAPARMCAPRP